MKNLMNNNKLKNIHRRVHGKADEIQKSNIKMKNDRLKFKNVEKKEETSATNDANPFPFFAMWVMG